MKIKNIIVNVVVFNGKKILIAKRSMQKTHAKGFWTIPGGKMEIKKGDEWGVLEETAHREVLEETGIEIHDDLMLLCNNIFIRDDNNTASLAITFVAAYKSGDVATSSETTQVEWISKNEMQNYTFAPNVRNYIDLAYIKSSKNVSKTPRF